MLSRSISIASSDKSDIQVADLAKHLVDASRFFESIPISMPTSIAEKKDNDEYVHFRMQSKKTNKEVNVYYTASCAKLHDILHQPTQQSDVNIIDVTQNCFTEKLFELWKSQIMKNPKKWTIALVDHFKEEGKQGNKLIFNSEKNVIILRKADVRQKDVMTGDVSFSASNLPQMVHTILFKPCINIIPADCLDQNKLHYIKRVLKIFFSDLIDDNAKYQRDNLPILIADKHGVGDLHILNEIVKLHQSSNAFFLIFWGKQEEKSNFKNKFREFISYQNGISYDDGINILKELIHIESKSSIKEFIHNLNQKLFNDYYYINNITNFEEFESAGEYIEGKINNIPYPENQGENMSAPHFTIHGSVGTVNTGSVEQSTTHQSNSYASSSDWSQIEAIFKSVLAENKIQEQALTELSAIKSLLDKLDKQGIDKAEKNMIGNLLASSKKTLETLKVIKDGSGNIEWVVNKLEPILSHIQSLF